MNLEDDKYLDIYGNSGSFEEAKMNNKNSLSSGRFKILQSNFCYYLDNLLMILAFVYLIFFINLVINIKVKMIFS